MAKPLAGVRVLDLTRLLPGGICTLLLADMGADIIKIEDPRGGDYARWMPPLLHGQGAFFRASNRNKRSMILNLKSEDGQNVLHRLVESADVLIEGFRPGVTARLGCDPETLHAINPRLIYASLSGWGQTGPYTYLSGHDLNYVSLNGLQGAMGTPQPLGGQIADVGGAYAAVMGITAALFKRERTGEGDTIDIALSEAGMPFAMYAFVESAVTGVPGGSGSLTGGAAFYDVYRSRDDRPMALAAIEPAFWKNFCEAVNRPDWLPLHTDPSEQERLRREIQALFATEDAATWHERLADADCCFTLITPPAQITDDPQIQARGMAGIDADTGLPWMRSPVHFQDDDLTRGTAPGYGQHTRAILNEAGYDDDTIQTLFDKGIVADKSED